MCDIERELEPQDKLDAALVAVERHIDELKYMIAVHAVSMTNPEALLMMEEIEDILRAD